MNAVVFLKRAGLAGSLFFLTFACASAPTPAAVSPPPPEPSLATRIDSAIARPPFHRAFWSIRIEEDDGRVLYARNDDKLTIPASNRKLFASATIASCLGITSRLATEVWRDGDDLVVRGGADPSLGSWRYERQDDFDDLAKLLRTRGIDSVRDVVADVSLFDRVTIPGGWKYGYLEWDYGAPVDALAWGENEHPVNHAVPNAALHAANALREALVLHGIEVLGDTRINVEPRVWSERITTIPSPFVGELLHAVLKNSQNLYTEMLLKHSGGGTYPGAFALEREYLTHEVGVDGDAFQFVDGSGLAPDDLVTPEATIRMLRWLNDPARRDFWWDTLAQPNTNGTLRRRLTEFEHRLRAKTGTINGVAALSGIIAMPDGRFRYFAIVTNHHGHDGSEAVKIIDEIVRMVG